MVLHSHGFQSASNVGFALLTPCLRLFHLIRTESSQTNNLESRDRREYQYRIEKADTKPFGISIGLDRGFF